MTEDITTLIPHRPPFLFVDKVTAITETGITTEKMISSKESFFQGHYPGNPIMPGVLICEAVFQSGAILISRILKDSGMSLTDSASVPVITRIKNVKFKNMVRPNNLLQMQVELIEKIGGAYFMKGAAKVNGKVVVRVEFAATVTDKVKQ